MEREKNRFNNEAKKQYTTSMWDKDEFTSSELESSDSDSEGELQGNRCGENAMGDIDSGQPTSRDQNTLTQIPNIPQRNSPRMYMLCAEFGAGSWRMVSLWPPGEKLVKPFPGAQRGKWFEHFGDGSFQLVQGQREDMMAGLDVKLHGLQANICLKIRLPVFFPARPHSFGSGIGGSGNALLETFIAGVHPKITGQVHCEITGLERQSVYYEAYVSLTSFNAPIQQSSTDQQADQLQWSIQQLNDILGPWQSGAMPGFDAGQQKKRVPLCENPTSSNVRPIVDMENNKEEKAMEANVKSKWAMDSPDECMLERRDLKDLKREPEFGRKSPAAVIPGIKYMRKEIFDEQISGFVYCWKVTTEDSFFLLFDAGTKLGDVGRQLTSRIQCNNKIIHGLTTAVGKWYRIDYARYKNSSVKQHESKHVQIRKICLDSEGETSLLKIDALWNSKTECFESRIGAVKIVEVPKKLHGSAGSRMFLCHLNAHNGNGQFVFSEDATNKPIVTTQKRAGSVEEGQKNKAEDETHEALVVCWRSTGIDAFLIACHPITGKFQQRMQVSHNRILGLGGKRMEVGQWYDILFSWYQRSDCHILLRKLPKQAKPMFETRINADGILQFRIHALKDDQKRSTPGGNGVISSPLFYSYVGGAPIVGNIPSNLLKNKAFLAWCRLNEKMDGNGENSFLFMEQIGGTGDADLRKTCEKFPSVVDLNNAKEVDEQSDIWPDEAFEVEDTGAYEIIQTAQKGEIEEQIVKEIPAPIHLLCPLMERLRLCDELVGCRLEEPESGSNAVRIIGTDRDAVKSGVLAVKRIRQELIKESGNEANAEQEQGRQREQPVGYQQETKTNVMPKQAQHPNGTDGHKANGGNEQRHTTYLQIPRHFYPWIRGPFNRRLEEVERQKGVQIILPDRALMGNSILLSGQRAEDVEQIKEKLKKMCNEKRNLAARKYRVPHGKQTTIDADAILERTNASVELPDPADQEQNVVIRGTNEEVDLAVRMLREQFGHNSVEEVAGEKQTAPTSKLEQILSSLKNKGPASAPAPKFGGNNESKGGMPQQEQQPRAAGNRRGSSTSGSSRASPKPVEMKMGTSSSSLKQNQFQRDRSVAANKPTTKIQQITVSVPKKFHGNLIGKDGSNLSRMQKKYTVRITVPTEYSTLEEVRIQGDDLAKVHKCRDDILELVDRLQNECFEKIYVQRRFLPLIVGTGGKKLNELRAKFPLVEDIDIPWAKNPKEGGDDDCCYITLYGRRNELSGLRDELNKIIAELEHRHHEDFLALPENDPAHSITEYIKFLRGTECSKIRKLNQKFPAVQVDFPIPNDPNERQNIISLRGPMEKVDEVKQILQNEIQHLKNRLQVEKIVPITDEKFIEKFFRVDAKLLKEIRGEHRKCFINLNKNTKCFEIEGHPEHAEAAKRRIEEILANMVEIVRNVQIDSKHHELLRARIGEFREKFRVKIKFPPPRQPTNSVELTGPSETALDEAERHLLSLCPINEQLEVLKEYRDTLLKNSGEHLKLLQQTYEVTIRLSLPRAGQHHQVVVIIEGTKQNVQRCVAAIKAELPVQESTLVPAEFRGALIGHNGENIKRMMFKHNVTISMPADSTSANVTGNCGDVRVCIQEIRAVISKLEKEKLEKSFQRSMFVPKELHGRLIGRAGAHVNELAERHNVKITFGGLSTNTATITGRQADCLRCEQEIRSKLALLQAGFASQASSTSSKPIPSLLASRITYAVPSASATASIDDRRIPHRPSSSSASSSSQKCSMM